ncbi:MAG: amidohydrolase family protein [Ignavibacteriales bacterium]|nr:amidohydrolase family protein [Ignavibacteriales bacterium]
METILFSPFHFKIYQTLQTENKLKFRIWSRSYGRIPQTTDLMRGMGIQKLGFIGPKIDFNKIHFHAIKYFEDMSLSVPNESTHDLSPGGEVFLTKDDLIDLFLLNPQNNLAFHVQGKEGLENIIDAINFTKDRIPYHRNVLDHVGYADLEQINEIINLNQSTTIIASQVFDYPHILNEYENSKIPLIENDLMNNRLKYNIAKAALTSDFPYGMDTSFADYKNVDGLNTFPNLAVNTCGKFPDGTVIKGFENKTISVNDAIKSYTENGAYVLGLEDKIGKIKPGYFADFIIVNQDIEKLDPMELYNTKVNQTYINGEKVYDINEKMITENNQEPIESILPYDYSISPIFGYDPSQSFIFWGSWISVSPINSQ